MPQPINSDPFIHTMGTSAAEVHEMCTTLGVKDTNQLMQEVLPEGVTPVPTADFAPLRAHELHAHLNELGAKNASHHKSWIGQGFYNTYMPTVVKRCILENPAWYTAYTPYQAEISQGRLELLFHFQSMICELTGLEVANASLLDEASASAEAMLMAKRLADKNANDGDAPREKILVDPLLFAHCKRVLATRAESLDLQIVEGDIETTNLDSTFFAAITAYPNRLGDTTHVDAFAKKCAATGVYSIVHTDLLALCVLPALSHVDIAIGNTQRFGMVLGYGGPHAAFMATRNAFVREMPGRIIGLSKDAQGKPAYRLTLQTREQHIKRQRATSNICTAEALPAVISTLYACYHGPDELAAIAQRVHKKTHILRAFLHDEGYTTRAKHSFDTIAIAEKDLKKYDKKTIEKRALEKQINLYYDHADGYISLSLDECTNKEDVINLASVFSDKALDYVAYEKKYAVLTHHHRKVDFLQDAPFQKYRTETEMMRYLKALESKDLSLCHAMIPLGSCTMKLNAADTMTAITQAQWANLHPYVPASQAKGYHEMIAELSKHLVNLTGLNAITFQPNSGAQGEYTGLMIMRAYHLSRGDKQRKTMLIPVSAHGTNPASAALAGMDIVTIACSTEKGTMDIADLTAKINEHKNTLAGIMITYPSTYGFYEESIREIIQLVHDAGGLVYMDGANMNAQTGWVSPGAFGADLCHLNLHKTFGIPHGGGGPGEGPVCVSKTLAPFLPENPITGAKSDTHNIGATSASPYGSALILLITYAYIRLLGRQGLEESTARAVLHANYIKKRVENTLPVMFGNRKGRVAHELILDLRGYKKNTGLDAVDVAKRLIDYSFHPPTVAFPIPGTLMIEPTESESKAEIDRFCDALISIAAEIKKIENGELPKDNNPILNAPHPMDVVGGDAWTFAYTRAEAAYPVESLRHRKFWPAIARIQDAYGDRNLVCSCLDYGKE